MEEIDNFSDSASCPHQRRRRRRRDFFEALQRSKSSGSIPFVDLGLRLREIRNSHGLSIRELARKCGLSVNTLSMIENGKNSPSLETLQQLAFTLDLPITSFFEQNPPKQTIVHCEASLRPRVTFENGTLEKLSSGLPKNGAETILVTLSPQSSSGNKFVVHTGTETVFCLEGQLTYTIDDQNFILNPGDSLFFEAHLPHHWQNTGLVPTRSLLVLSPSDDRDSPTERHFPLDSVVER